MRPPARPLITPALFSHRTPPNREKREKGKDASNCVPLSRSVGGRWERGQG
ncbi:MAG: hypothetical protein QOF89_1536 [Acidobacteriota bacterium]|jgi:hypothetical protein|nr:hypothetical protein [Acidobacteriota bacterium]